MCFILHFQDISAFENKLFKLPKFLCLEEGILTGVVICWKLCRHLVCASDLWCHHWGIEKEPFYLLKKHWKLSKLKWWMALPASLNILAFLQLVIWSYNKHLHCMEGSWCLMLKLSQDLLNLQFSFIFSEDIFMKILVDFRLSTYSAQFVKSNNIIFSINYTVYSLFCFHNPHILFFYYSK